MFSLFFNFSSILNKLEAQQIFHCSELTTRRHSIHVNWAGSTELAVSCHVSAIDCMSDKYYFYLIGEVTQLLI